VKIVLAGFNADIPNGSTTPETLCAAYARISRDPRPIGELRAESAVEVEAARRSNRRIVFGYGHSSIAEHAVFNLDLTGVSRVAAEYIQSFRLASFTEKSQRYIRLSEDWVVPDEIGEGGAGFTSGMSELFGMYRKALGALRKAGFREEAAKEDARYLLPLCTTCQMGMTVNARELEHMAARLRAAPVGEVRRLGGALVEAVSSVAPSLLRHTDPSPMDRFSMEQVGLSGRDDVSLSEWDDDSAVGCFLLRRLEPLDAREAREAWKALGEADRRSLFDQALRDLGPHDAVPRCWELARFVFDLSISSSAFAQLKRHRMCTILVSSLPDPGAWTTPPSFEDAGLSGLLREAVSVSSSASALLQGPASAYARLNAHRRRLVISMNAREMYHFCRLRADEHAQWDIRAAALEMLAQARGRAPLTMSRAGGRSDFETARD